MGQKNFMSRTANLLTGRTAVIGVLYSLLRQDVHHRQLVRISSLKLYVAEPGFVDFGLAKAVKNFCSSFFVV